MRLLGIDCSYAVSARVIPCSMLDPGAYVMPDAFQAKAMLTCLDWILLVEDGV